MVQALVREIELRAPEFKDITVETIYFGGGTPSLLSIEALQLLIDTVYKNYSVIEAPEITLEANPDDLVAVQGKSGTIFEEYKSIGINRLSIGIQSFFEEDLKLMNRAHNANEAKRCLKDASAYFENISVDLIYGIPGASNEKWLQNIQTALAFNIPHISSYALTVEPNTALDRFIKKGVIENVDDGLAEQQFQLLVETLEASGFIHYELSNFGKPNYFSKNNTAYWLGKPYIGIGPSAHSYNGRIRGWNVRNNSKYINALNDNVLPIETETLSVTDRYNEYIMTGLRTIWGVSLDKIETEFGVLYKKYALEQASNHLNNDLLYIKDNKLHVTKKGKFLSDGIASDLFKINLK